MNDVLVGVLVDGLIAVLLLITIGFCIALCRRLALLRVDEHVLQATIEELAAAGRQAEETIMQLRAMADDAEAVLEERAQSGAHLAGELESHVAAAESVLARIVAMSRAVRPGEPRPAVQRRVSFNEADAA